MEQMNGVSYIRRVRFNYYYEFFSGALKTRTRDKFNVLFQYTNPSHSYCRWRQKQYVYFIRDSRRNRSTYFVYPPCQLRTHK